MAVMIFNPTTYEQREVTEADADKAVREYGWLRAGGEHELVAIHHPGTRDNKMVLKRDVATWENKGYFSEPTMIYHPEQGERIVPASEAHKHRGWYDSPAKFPGAEKEHKEVGSPVIPGGTGGHMLKGISSEPEVVTVDQNGDTPEEAADKAKEAQEAADKADTKKKGGK